MQSSRFRLFKVIPVLTNSILDLFRQELFHLLRSASNKRAGVKKRIQLLCYRLKEWAFPDAVDQIVVLAVPLDNVGCLM